MRISVNGVRLFFDVEGAGIVPSGSGMTGKPVLILLHGGPGYDHSGFKPEFGQLADIAQVIYLDLRGNGRSDRSEPHTWNLSQWAADLREFCTALDIVKPVILGQSFGGEVAMKYAATHPETLQKLILLSATGRLRMDRVLDCFERLGGADIRALAEAYWHNPTPEVHRDYYRRCLPLYTRRPLDPDVLRRALVHDDVARHYNGGEALTCNLLPGLAGVTCPTLVMGGMDDPITTIEDAADIVRALPPGVATFVAMRGCRHGPVREAPQFALGVLRAFLKDEPVPCGVAEAFRT